LLKLLAGSVCISFSPIFIKIAATDPELAGFYRMLFAGISLFLLFLLRQETLNIPRRPMIFLIPKNRAVIRDNRKLSRITARGIEFPL
jgi:drug/metabolite transporter (DMT)-like permease